MQPEREHKQQQKRHQQRIAVEPGEAVNFASLVFTSRLVRIQGMRRAALIEEAAEHNQRAMLQDGGLPIGGQAVDEGLRRQKLPIAARPLPECGKSLVLQPPAGKTLRGNAHDEKREQHDRERTPRTAVISSPGRRPFSGTMREDADAASERPAPGGDLRRATLIDALLLFASSGTLISQFIGPVPLALVMPMQSGLVLPGYQ
jgi:hypothetical protein